MDTYVCYLMRHLPNGMVEEARVILNHQIAPQFKLGEKTLLTEGQVLFLFDAINRSLSGEKIKINLVSFTLCGNDLDEKPNSV